MPQRASWVGQCSAHHRLRSPFGRYKQPMASPPDRSVGGMPYELSSRHPPHPVLWNAAYCILCPSRTPLSDRRVGRYQLAAPPATTHQLAPETTASYRICEPHGLGEGGRCLRRFRPGPCCSRDHPQGGEVARGWHRHPHCQWLCTRVPAGCARGCASGWLEWGVCSGCEGMDREGAPLASGLRLEGPLGSDWQVSSSKRLTS